MNLIDCRIIYDRKSRIENFIHSSVIFRFQGWDTASKLSLDSLKRIILLGRGHTSAMEFNRLVGIFCLLGTDLLQFENGRDFRFTEQLVKSIQVQVKIKFDHLHLQLQSIKPKHIFQ